MKYKILIDRNSIKKNPNAGNTVSTFLGSHEIKINGKGKIPDELIDGENYYLLEETIGDENKEWSGIIINPEFLKNVVSKLPNIVIEVKNYSERINHAPEPKYFYTYIPTIVVCNNCKSNISSEKLKSDSIEFFDGEDEYYKSSNKICPICDEWDCCEIEYENIKEVAKEINT